MTIVVAAAIVREAKLLLAQRSYPAEVAGLWELPGGKVEGDESLADALKREIAEELGVVIDVGERVGVSVEVKRDVELLALQARIVEGEPSAREHDALRWVDAVELAAMVGAEELVPADAAWLDDLVDLLRG